MHSTQDGLSSANTKALLTTIQGKWERVQWKLTRDLYAVGLTRWLTYLNRTSKSSIICPDNKLAVSLTSHGKRLDKVFLAIESIGRGKMLPAQIILWIDDAKALTSLSPEIDRLITRGLEVRLSSRNYGPHTKYYPYVVQDLLDTQPLVTADDDILYPYSWLTKLWEAQCQHPDVINCYRARVIRLDGNGKLRPYSTWKECKTKEASLRHFLTGVSGVIYPAEFLKILRSAGEEFLYCCPKADDIWLHVQAVRAGYRVRQIGSKARHFPTILNSQVSALHLGNVSLSGNDLQVQNTYRAADLEMILRG